MGKNLCYFLFLLWFSYLIVSSVLLFTRGFLLSREVQDNNSTCVRVEELPCAPDNESCSYSDKINSVLRDLNSASEVCLPPRAKVILLIVDALRHDFTVYDEKNTNPLPFQNKLPIIDRLVKQFPNSTRLAKFIADPPTTTMQRLKGLTTGSLPTFIDAGSNFATSEINEDNIIDQLTRNNYNVVFTGDDTWNGLYPRRFIRNYPYPSFNVWDLDTVDYGVRDTLDFELNTTDWQLLIGHFLGVDHCGHRYGPNHPEMERKLGEINRIIEDVVDRMDGDTMLFVIGDHGMTVTGDHGGETEDETTAGIFVYHKQPLTSSETPVSSVKQVDLVPTLAVILGVPIPFQNLGILVDSFLPKLDSIDAVQPWQISLFNLWSNVQQVMKYLDVYSGNSDTFNQEILKVFREKYRAFRERVAKVSSEDDFRDFSKDLIDFLKALRSMCEEVWVQFDTFSMTRGMILLFMSMFFMFLIVDGVPLTQLAKITRSGYLHFSFWVQGVATVVIFALNLFGFVDNLLTTVFFITGVISQFMLALLVIQNWETISLNWYSRSKRERIQNLVCRLVLVLNICGLFSNSYINEEASLLLFLLVTVILVSTLGVNVTDGPKRNKPETKWPKFKFILYGLITAALVRASMYFWRCRAEQEWCFSSPHEVSSILTKTETTKIQWGMTVLFLAVFVFATKQWLKNCGNLNGFSLTVTSVKFLPTVMVVCISGYWVLSRLPNRNRQNLKSDLYLALSVYALTFTGILSVIFRPLCTFIVSNEPIDDGNIIPYLYKKIKGCFVENKGQPTEKDDVPVICGLGTAYSAVFVIIGVYLTLLFSLLLGDAVAPSAVIMFVTASFVLIVTSVFRIESAESIESLFEIPNVSILIWVILSQYFFYATGHQPAFPNISWEAAFVGTTGNFDYNFVPATLIILNTFCSYILMGVLLPLVLVAPFTVFVMIPTVVSKKKDVQLAAQRGEVLLFERDTLMVTSVFTMMCKYVMGHGIRVFASMLAATIHCRHLMVWNVFAPKLIFESIGIFVTLVSVLVSYLILVRINGAVEKLIMKLNKMS